MESTGDQSATGRDQKWWTRTYPMIVGQKGAVVDGVENPALNAVEQWKSQDRIQALLGASISTVRWREIIDESKIVFVALNNDGSETDNLLARLLVGEMVAALRNEDCHPTGMFDHSSVPGRVPVLRAGARSPSRGDRSGVAQVRR